MADTSTTSSGSNLPGHEIKIQVDGSPNKPLEANGSNQAITVYKLDTQKPISELEQDAKALAIPDVVVEYIKESFNRDGNNMELGTLNPAFEPQELIVVRTPSSLSLRDDVKKDTSSEIGRDNKLYNSLPNSAKKTTADASSDSSISQGATPKMSRFLGVNEPNMYASSSSSLGYPRSIPPSPNFGYRPLESESSAIYTIIAPVKYLNSAEEKERELKLLTELRAQLEKEKALKRKFEFSPAPIEVERRRQRLQCCTDVCSTMFLIPGIFIAIVTPISLIPMFYYPLKFYIPLIAIFIVSGIISVLSLAMSGFMGNIVWHYDPDKRRIRPRMHCGRGPLLHFWGNGFYSDKEDKKPLNGEKIV